LTLDKTKETLANKLYESIQKSKNTDLVTFLSSLGISGGAYNKCEKVVQSGIHTIDQIKKLTIEDLIKIDSFAEKSAQDFLTSLQEKYEIIDELLGLGFVIAEKEITKTEFTGKKICITGELTRKRSEIENEIREIGGIVVSSVSKNTDYLLTNEVDSASSKFKKAKELSITIISEEDFFKRIKTA
jgi:DNA ligase (NAD+)